MTNFELLKQLGLKSLNQIAGQIKEYCSSVVQKGKDYGYSLISFSSGIHYDPNADPQFTFDNETVNDAQLEAIDAFKRTMLRANQARDITLTEQSRLVETYSNEKGQVFQLIKDTSGNLIDGANNVVFDASQNVLQPLITNAEGQSTYVAQLGKDLINNCQLYDTLQKCIDNVITGTDASFNYILTEIKAEYGTISQDARYIIESIREVVAQSGTAGAIQWVKSWFESMKTMSYDEDEAVLKFTDNSQYMLISNLAGCIGGLLLTGLQVAGAVLTAIFPIVGFIVTGTTKIVSTMLNFAATAMDANALGSIRWKENGNYEYPNACFQWKQPISDIMSANSSYKPFYNALLYQGSFSINVPGGDLLCWLDSSGNNMMCEFHVTPFLKTLDISSIIDDYDGVLHGNNVDLLIPSTDKVWEYYLQHCDNELKQLKQTRWSVTELDKELVYRYYLNLAIFFLWLLSSCKDYGAVGSYRLHLDGTSSGSAYSDLVPFWKFITWLDNPSRINITSNFTWTDICDPAGALSFLLGKVYYEGSANEYDRCNVFNTYFSEANHVTITYSSVYSSQMSNYQSIGTLYTVWHGQFWTSKGPLYYTVTHDLVDYSPIVHFGDYYIDEPKTSLTSVIGAVIITALIAVTTIIAANIIKKKVAKCIYSKRAKLAAGVETSWQNYLTNPCGETYEAYYAAVRKNNLWSKFIGGTSYSLDGMWGDASGSGDTASTSGSTNAFTNQLTAFTSQKISEVDESLRSQLSSSEQVNNVQDTLNDDVIAKLNYIILKLTGESVE